ncbi:hypothetical protein D3C85_1798340 [compost metagenome]
MAPDFLFPVETYLYARAYVLLWCACSHLHIVPIHLRIHTGRTTTDHDLRNIVGRLTEIAL